jgi:hypothetical protein
MTDTPPTLLTATCNACDALEVLTRVMLEDDRVDAELRRTTLLVRQAILPLRLTLLREDA